VNPLITLTTMLGGLTGFARGVLYLVAQTIGAGVAGGLIRGSFGNLTAQYQGGGCYLDSKLISDCQAYLIESVLSFCMAFLAYGVGLNPRQQTVFGAKLWPLLIGCSLGLISFSSIGLAAGFPGVSVNPARCFAFAVARGNFRHQWIWWLGPLTGTLLQGILCNVAPPYHREIDKETVAGLG